MQILNIDKGLILIINNKDFNKSYDLRMKRFITCYYPENFNLNEFIKNHLRSFGFDLHIFTKFISYKK